MRSESLDGSTNGFDAELDPAKCDPCSAHWPDRNQSANANSGSGDQSADKSRQTAKTIGQTGLVEVKEMDYLRAIDLLYAGQLDRDALAWVRHQREDATTPIGAYFARIKRQENEWLGS